MACCPECRLVHTECGQNETVFTTWVVTDRATGRRRKFKQRIRYGAALSPLSLWLNGSGGVVIGDASRMIPINASWTIFPVFLNTDMISPSLPTSVSDVESLRLAAHQSAQGCLPKT